VSDGVQPGTRIDPSLWEEFREDIEARKGAVRGHLQTELENAIRQYLSDEPDPIQEEIRDRLSRLEQSAGLTPADGGTDTCGADSHTHAPERTERVPDERPSPNAASEKKVRYLAHRLIERESLKPPEFTVPKNRLREVVKDEYGFRSDTAKRYVGHLIDHFDLRPHPHTEDKISPILVTPDRHADLVEQQREETTAEADDELDRLDDDAEVADAQ